MISSVMVDTAFLTYDSCGGPIDLTQQINNLMQIVVLDQGRVIESGTHADLLSRDSRYAEMWKRQATVDDTAHLLSAK